ncbi:MAG: septum formation initiator family protein [Oscillospiraceae bacterium]|nr:septum formation initiator family protein [Oscillospiraceae bacterium]MDD3833661.1 septum formation initiator family protein [Oscillospiraceae bacterium]
MKVARTKKKKKSIFLRIALAAFSVYVVVMLIQLQLEFSDKQKVYAQKSENAEKLKKENEELGEQNQDYTIYLEKKARERNLARPGETVYVGIPGN